MSDREPVAATLEIEMEIGCELYSIFRGLGATSDLLGVVGSWSEGEITGLDLLDYLRAYNRAEREEREDVGRRLLEARHAHRPADLATLSAEPHHRCGCGLILKGAFHG